MKYIKKIEINYLLIVIILIFLDIILKIYFTNKIFLFSDLIYIMYSKNFGSSLGIFSNLNYYSYIIISLATICIFAVIHYRKYFLKDKFLSYASIFFLSGVIGNTIDRIFYGYVRDFIVLKNLFIFNFADLYITIAFICYVLYEIEMYKKNIQKN